MIEYVEDRKGHDKRYGLNCDKINKLFGEFGSFDFEKSMNDTVMHFVKENRKD